MNNIQKSIVDNFSKIIDQQNDIVSSQTDMIAMMKDIMSGDIDSDIVKAVKPVKAVKTVKTVKTVKPGVEYHTHCTKIAATTGLPCKVKPVKGTNLCWFHSKRSAKKSAGKLVQPPINNQKSVAKHTARHKTIKVTTKRRWVYVTELNTALESGNFETLTLDIAKYQMSRLRKALFTAYGWSFHEVSKGSGRYHVYNVKNHNLPRYSATMTTDTKMFAHATA